MGHISEDSAVAAISIFLTLVGLIGTFFYIHLSSWLSDLLQLKSKWDLNATGESPERKEARLECRYEIKRLLNHIPILVSVVTTGFLIFISEIARRMSLEIVSEPASFWYYKIAYKTFLIVYLILTAYLLIFGYVVGCRLKRKMEGQ
jgi:hypothetical protein